MKRCGICEHELLPNPLIIKDVPDSTFEINDNKTTLNLYECPICGAVQLKDVPLSKDYWVSKKSIGVSSGYREAKKKKLKDFTDDYYVVAIKDCVEIGCGEGEYLKLLHELDVNVCGYDDIDSACLLDKLYGCTFLFYYLEHMPYPKSFMEIVYENTKPNGLVYIEVPNYDYIVSHGIWLEFTKDHRFYYGKRSMTYLLSSCGFEIEELDNYTDDCLTVVARKPKDCGTLDKMKERMEQDIKRFNEVTKGFGKYNVYGAGRHSLMMLSKAQVKPQRIFDSNPAKVGSKIGGVTIEHGDNAVNSVSMFEPIIIMCAGYNAEVKEKLTGKNIMEWR
jgi:hypothetical protein